MNHMQVMVCLVSSATSAGSTWAFAVSADLDVNELGNSDDADTSVQNDAEIMGEYLINQIVRPSSGPTVKAFVGA